MPENYDSINLSLNTDSNSIEVNEKHSSVVVDPINVIEDSNKEISLVDDGDIKKDYEYTRANLYSLIEKGQEAINGIMELAQESDQPRAYEVAGQLIKSVADTTDKLIDLQKKLKDIEEDSGKKPSNITNNNALFVGSTAELSKILKQGFLNNKE
jgi:hypothetical protein